MKMGLRDKAKVAKIIEESNIYLTQAQKGLELCSDIISLGKIPFQNSLSEIDDILNEFMILSQNDTNKMGVRVYKELLSLRDDIINITSFSKLENHYTVAVGGSFSAGKSTFLNKVLGLDGVLPTDTNPTTSISSYITKGKEESFTALNNFNNIIKLDKEAIQAISHAFHKRYDVSFSHILKLISIEHPRLKYDNLVFLDTPGYSKSDDIDENVAKEHLRNTDFLIWLVEAQTPISSSDMAFIKTLNLQHPLLVVLNKADKKTPQDRDALVQKTRENLKENKIPFFDVVAYSSAEDIEYSNSQNIIQTYLNTISQNERGTKILHNLNDVFKLYIDYYDSQLIQYRETRGLFNEILLKEAVEDEYMSKIQTLSSKIIKQIQDIEKSKKSVIKLNEKFYEILMQLLNENGISIVEYEKKYIFDKSLYSIQKNLLSTSEVTYRFEALLQIKNSEDLLKYKDLDSIEGSVYKVSSIGVFVSIRGMKGDIMIPKSKILKEDSISSIDEVFQKDTKVLVQILKEKKCIVMR